MSFLTLNGTPIPCRSNACDVKDVEHRADRARMFSGDIRLTRGAIYREFTIVTAFQNETDYATIRALINSNNLPLTAAGDLIGTPSIYVMPVPGSWTPIQTADGFRRQAKFTLQETITTVLPDTSAVPWAFYRRGVGYWQDRAATTPASVGDVVDRWDDQSGNGRFIFSHNGEDAGPDGTPWAGSRDYRPTRDSSTTIYFGEAGGPEGAAEMRPGDGDNPYSPDMSEFNECEILFGIRAQFDPAPLSMSLAAWSSGVGPDVYPDSDGHLRFLFGLSGLSLHDAGDPSVDLTGWNCLNLSGSNVTDELIVRLNDDTLLTYPTGGSPFLWDFARLGNGGGDGHHFQGWFRDIVIFTSLLTDTQRLAWKNYIRGFTSLPPL